MNFGISNGIDWTEIGKSLCNLEKYGNLSTENFNICKGAIYGSLLSKVTPNIPLRFKKAYKKLKNDKDLHITRADKSNTLVIMDMNAYNGKMNMLLSDETTYEKLRSNPLEKENSLFNRKIKSLLKGHDELIKKFIKTNATLPYLYGIIKTHKQNNPVRPIVSSVGSASYELSKWLVTELSPILGTVSSFSVKNNIDFIEKLKSSNINYKFKLISFDVTSLFTRVPVDNLLEYLADILENYNLTLPCDTIIELIKMCVIDCKFTFDDCFYKQKFGMSMGNPLSPLLSNLYMEFFEIKLLPQILPSNIFWARYVDDIFCAWPVNVDEKAFLERLNSLVPSINFTLEEELDSSLPFLDVKVIRTQNGFNFSVFRKETNVCSYVHFYSNHPLKTKLSVFSSMFLRAFRVCSPEYVEEEFLRIREIGHDLKYPDFIIDTALKKARKTFFGSAGRTTFSLNNIIVLPFYKNFIPLFDFFKCFGITLVFGSGNTIKSTLIKNSPLSKSGCIYKIPCKDCDKFYIGQSGKSIDTRLKQHKYCVRTGNMSNAIFIHINNCNHMIGWKESKEIVFCNNVTKRNIIESSIIKEYSNNLLNISSGLYRLDNWLIKHVVKQLLVK